MSEVVHYCPFGHHYFNCPEGTNYDHPPDESFPCMECYNGSLE